jgi:predicted CXXCH cytochrome family protein
MKTTKIILMLVVSIMIASQVGYSQGTIVGSKHDFSAATWNVDIWSTGTTAAVRAYGGQICKICHTPHGGVTGLTAPLWGHAITTATYSVYDNAVSSTMDAIVGQPDGASKLCLSCHDGTVAVDNYYPRSASTLPGIGTTLISGVANLGVDLSNDHPIGFTYDDALATLDGGLHPPSTTTIAALGGTIQNKMLILDKMQCSSCHDAHNTPGLPKMLTLPVSSSTAPSALCLACHKK